MSAVVLLAAIAALVAAAVVLDRYLENQLRDLPPPPGFEVKLNPPPHDPTAP